jgi:hypothetical protein
MKKFFILSLALLLALPATAMAERDMYVMGTGETPDQETQDNVNRTREEMLRMRADAARSGIFFYNGDEGVYIGRGSIQTYHYNRRSGGDATAACSGLRQRKYERCVEDAAEVRQDLMKKYRD